MRLDEDDPSVSSGCKTDREKMRNGRVWVGMGWDERGRMKNR